MAEIKTISLHNFKGVEGAEIRLRSGNHSPVITLIGLNESGKTTLLEGLSHFVSGDNAVTGIFEGIHAKSATAELIPLHRKAAFSADVKIRATVVLDETDLRAAQKTADERNFTIDNASFPKEITVTRAYTFEDSTYRKSSNYWTFVFQATPLRGKKSVAWSGPSAGETNLWSAIVETLSARLPRIAYFPTFLVDMPTRIYLREHPNERPVNRYYRIVIQDILDSMNDGLTLERHVCKRIEDFQKSEDSSWLSRFLTGPTKAPIDSVFQKISNAVTREVLGSWRRIFQRPISANSIFVEWHVDTENDGLPYASFIVTDGESRYQISERSLGFRWFFSFLLFTAFKQAANKKTIFVFDEPAANLHAKAQAELLKNFQRIVADGHSIVYSTHSHHMINPHWLSGAYIVENTSLDYDAEDSFDLGGRPTDIRATTYRHFVSQYPTRTSYFQPVIERLDYVSPEILGREPYLIVEGITDYYAFKLASQGLARRVRFSLMPGSGAASLGPTISLLLARGERFLILLDDDRAGRMAAERYRQDWFLPASAIQTLGNIKEKFKGMKLEDLLSPRTLEAIRERFAIDGKPSKSQIGWFLSELCSLEKGASVLSEDTIESLQEVLRGVGTVFDNAQSAGAISGTAPNTQVRRTSRPTRTGSSNRQQPPRQR